MAGPLLDIAEEQWQITLQRSKEKQALVTAMQETMLNLLPSAVYLNTNIDLGMGFLIGEPTYLYIWFSYTDYVLLAATVSNIVKRAQFILDYLLCAK